VGCFLLWDSAGDIHASLALTMPTRRDLVGVLFIYATLLFIKN